MDLDCLVKMNAVTIPSELKNPEPSTTHPVSRWGALLAASLLRLPGDDGYKMHQEYSLSGQD